MGSMVGHEASMPANHVGGLDDEHHVCEPGPVEGKVGFLGVNLGRRSVIAEREPGGGERGSRRNVCQRAPTAARDERSVAGTGAKGPRTRRVTVPGVNTVTSGDALSGPSPTPCSPSTSATDSSAITNPPDLQRTHRLGSPPTNRPHDRCLTTTDPGVSSLA